MFFCLLESLARSLPATFPADIPCLYLGASKDPAFPPALFTERARTKLFPAGNLDALVIQDGNHFMHQVSISNLITL